MKADAARAGIDIGITSSFRDFFAQERIWNMKWRGERPLYDTAGRVREHAALAPRELIEAILCWSALPGASRHHWGTELTSSIARRWPPTIAFSSCRRRRRPAAPSTGCIAGSTKTCPVMDSSGRIAPFVEASFRKRWHLSFAPWRSRHLQVSLRSFCASRLQRADARQGTRAGADPGAACALRRQRGHAGTCRGGLIRVPNARSSDFPVYGFRHHRHLCRAGESGPARAVPESAVIDLLNDLAPFDVEAAAHLLEALARQLPDGAVTICVVDPGVGSTRGAVALFADGRGSSAPIMV